VGRVSPVTVVCALVTELLSAGEVTFKNSFAAAVVLVVADFVADPQEIMLKDVKMVNATKPQITPLFTFSSFLPEDGREID